MSWSLLIHNNGEPIGTSDEVRSALNSVFNGLEWSSDSECSLPIRGGFIINWAIEEGTVQDGYTNGGFNHLKEFVSLCKAQGWGLADAQEGEEIDLDNPYAFYGGEPGE